MLEEDLKVRKAEFEERSRVSQDKLNEALAEQQKSQITLRAKADEAVARA